MRRLINVKPVWGTRFVLGMIPFVVLLFIYVTASNARLSGNSQDKLLPSFKTMQSSVYRMATVPRQRDGTLLLCKDTVSSLRRLGAGVLIASVIGLIWGLATGALPLATATLAPLLTAASMVPTLALLPVLLIIFGIGELSKVALIVFGITPFIAREVRQRCEEIPREQLTKAQTLGASSLQIICSVLLPQLMPKLLQAMRLSLGAGWLFLIASEAIAATEGLGYRIFLVRRYLSMEVILPYVAWITLLSFVFDGLLRKTQQWLYPWEGGESTR